MNPISDNDLILYHYKDGLDTARLTEISAALAASAGLQSRYGQLCHLLDATTGDAPQPSAGYENRTWSRFEQRINEAHQLVHAPSLVERMRAILQSALRRRFVLAGGLACALLIALGVGFQVGRMTPPITVVGAPVAPEVEIQGDTRNMANRVLDGYVSGHLRATEGLLLTAVNADGSEFLDGNRELAKSLVDSNRLYAVAAARAGNVRLADFLRQIEPVLLEVANQSDSSTVEDRQGLRDYLQKSDLLFQVRATESRIDPASKRSL